MPVVLLAIALVAPAAAQPPEWAAPFCDRAQQVIAGTALRAAVQLPRDLDAFVQSKAGSAPLTVQEFLANPASGDPSLPRSLSCKMRTAERINAAHADGGEPVATGDASCAAVHRDMLATVAASIPAEELALPPERFVIEEEHLTFMGPAWLRPWPFEPVSRGGAGELLLHSRSLYVPRAWWIPMPERFQGNYYCHLVAPKYLEALLRGRLQP